MSIIISHKLLLWNRGHVAPRPSGPEDYTQRMKLSKSALGCEVTFVINAINGVLNNSRGFGGIGYRKLLNPRILKLCFFCIYDFIIFLLKAFNLINQLLLGLFSFFL